MQCTHHSGGGDNLKKGDGYQKFMQQGKKFFDKWKDKFPYIATTTTNFTPERIHYYIADVLGLEPRYYYYKKQQVKENKTWD